MKYLSIYCIFDSASGEYGLPFFAHNEIVAERQACLSLNSLPLEYWTDFELLHLGSFECSSGKIEGFDSPVVHCDGKELVNTFKNLYKENTK